MAVMPASPRDQPPGGWPAPKAAYLHVPLCRHHCGYCNFSVIAGRDDLADRFLSALDIELASWGRPSVESIFIGGGTPTQLSVEKLDELLVSIHRRLELSDDYEWTVEANPEDITPDLVSCLHDRGVNRISLGVQSFDASKLRILERGHDAALAKRAIETVASRIANVSADLIFATPGESPQVWRDDLEIALDCPLTHLSTYALTYEKGTRFWNQRNRGQLSEVPEDTEIDLYQLARGLTAAAGYTHYEISNFARDPFQCDHNLTYWRGRSWLAAGPGAARFVEGRRETNHRSPTNYLRRIESGVNPTAETELISPPQHARERVAFGVRMLAGVDLGQIERETGVDLDPLFGDAVNTLVAEGLLWAQGRHVKLTERGLLLADTVASRFLA